MRCRPHDERHPSDVSAHRNSSRFGARTVSGRACGILLELVRIRIAQLIQAPAEAARRTPEAVVAGLDEETVAELACSPSHHVSTTLTARCAPGPSSACTRGAAS